MQDFQFVELIELVVFLAQIVLMDIGEYSRVVICGGKWDKVEQSVCFALVPDGLPQLPISCKVKRYAAPVKVIHQKVILAHNFHAIVILTLACLRVVTAISPHIIAILVYALTEDVSRKHNVFTRVVLNIRALRPIPCRFRQMNGVDLHETQICRGIIILSCCSMCET